MRRYFLRVLIGVGLASSMAGPARAADWSDRLFSEQGHDFGPVARGSKVRHPFVLTNRTGEAITIANVRASCGCTTGRASATLVPPGGTAVVEAEMDTRNFVGKKATVLFVMLMSASGREAEVRLAVSSTILSDVVVDPGQVDFGAVSRGASPSQAVVIERLGSPGFKIHRMITVSKAIDASLVETKRGGDSVGYSLTVKLLPDAPSGTIRDEIRLLTNDAETPSIPLLVTAQVRGDLSASPGIVSMGRVPPKGEARGRFIVRSSKPFAITGVEGSGDGFQVGPVEGGKKAVHIVNVAYRADQGTSRGDLHRSLRIATDLPGEAPVDVAVTLHVDP